jgi:hypothetical protein
MKITERKAAAKHDDFLTSVARSIGSTLGAVAAKVDEATRPARRRRRPAGRKRARKHSSVSRATRRGSDSVSKRSHATARLATSKRKKSSK